MAIRVILNVSDMHHRFPLIITIGNIAYSKNKEKLKFQLLCIKI